MSPLQQLSNTDQPEANMDILSRPASSLVDQFDAQHGLSRFLAAIERITMVPKEAVRAALASDGTVAEALASVGATEFVLEDVRAAGARDLKLEIAHLERQANEARSQLAKWNAYLDGDNNHE